MFLLGLRAEERVRNERLEKERDVALGATRAKSEFLGNMSHELRTPLNAIIGFSQMIEKEINSSSSKGYARDIRTSGQHLLSLINDLLELDRIERGKVGLEEREFDLLPVVADCVRLVGSVDQNVARDIRIETSGEPLLVFADQRVMSQILINLLGNATKFSRAGGLVRVDHELNDIGELVIHVIDDGIGISRSALTEIFEPYVQANAQIARSHGGTGLGLAIIKEQVELHGGSIDIKSNEGAGTAVSVTLPAARICARDKAVA